MSMQTWGPPILTGVGAPVSNNNISKLTAWNACEDGSSSQLRNNPFNTTLSGSQYGGYSINSDGVKVYPSFTSGVKATVDSIIYTKSFSGILQNLRSDGSFSDFVAALSSSGWGTNASCVSRSLGSAKLTSATSSASCQCFPAGSSSAANPVTICADLTTGTPCIPAGGCPAGADCSGSYQSPTFGQQAPFVGFTGSGSDANCQIQFPGVAGVGSFCLWQAGWSRALLGGLCLTAGAVVMLTGVVLMTGRSVQAVPMGNQVSRFTQGMNAPGAVNYRTRIRRR